jgi:hypothetical protein
MCPNCYNQIPLCDECSMRVTLYPEPRTWYTDIWATATITVAVNTSLTPEQVAFP